MGRLLFGQLLRRGSRSVALLLGLLVACASFTVLTSQSRAESLQVQGTVHSTIRSAYDILVRPRGAQSALEKQDGLVQAGFLTQVHGGISLAQWHQVQQIPGVQVAAPVAVIGYVMPKIVIPVNASKAVRGTSGRTLIRVDSTWRTDNGSSVERARPRFLYVTPHPLTTSTQGLQVITTETGPDGRRHAVCTDTAGTAPWTVQSGPTTAECSTRAAYLQQVSQHQTNSLSDVTFAFPFLVEAVDPTAEAKLAGLKGAITAGRYLTSGPLTRRAFGQSSSLQVPVLVASQPATHVAVHYQLVQLPAADATAVATDTAMSRFTTSPGKVVRDGSADQGLAYRTLLAAMATPTSHGDYFADQLSYLYTTGPTSYRATGILAHRVLSTRTVRNARGVWADPVASDAIGTLIPAGGDDTAFRTMAAYGWNNQNPRNLAPPVFVKHGTFDAAKLPGYSALSRVPLGTYASTVLTGATPRARKVLGGAALPPSPNIAGYVQPAPLMITTLSALPAFEASSGYWSKLSGDRSGASFAPVNAKAPISSIRVRVDGVHGIDPVSRERVRLVAQQIAARTQLSVDVTVGSSPAPQTIVLPAGQHGRPQLVLHENWVKKGVAVAIVDAVNKKSLALFVLVLLVCGLFVANTAAASVRSRRRELGTLTCLGWSRARLFVLVLAELVVIATVAGIGGAVLAYLVGSLIDVQISPGRAALALPAALAVAVIAGAGPAWQATRATPLEAIQPAVAAPRRAGSVRTVTGLAWTNVRRTLGRSLVAAVGLGIAAAALTLIAGITIGFHGAVVGTLLGNAIAVQVRGADYAAITAILVLAGVGVANVLYLSIRDRGAELATLGAVGWTPATVDRLLATEGTIIGTTGAFVGSGIGLAALVRLTGSHSATLVLAAVGAFVIALAVALIGTALPVLSLHRLPTALLLTEE